jgi:hypothetical protein
VPVGRLVSVQYHRSVSAVFSVCHAVIKIGRE